MPRSPKLSLPFTFLSPCNVTEALYDSKNNWNTHTHTEEVVDGWTDTCLYGGQIETQAEWEGGCQVTCNISHRNRQLLARNLSALSLNWK
jgi:hypothetical protein